MSNEITTIDDIDMPALNEYPLDASVKYHGPPGTGKTTTSMGRVGRIVENDDLEYGIGDVAWVTYRSSLASDMLHTAAEVDLIPRQLVEDKEARLESNVRYWGTVHAVAARAWQELADYQIVTDHHKREFCRGVLNEPFSTSNPYQDAIGSVILRTVQWCRKNLIAPTDPKAPVEECPHYDEVQARWGGDIAVAARRWDQYKQAVGNQEEDVDPVVDFVDLLEIALNRNVVLPTDILVIDEYHDAYPLFAAVCKKWMQHHDIVIAAGDPHQTINSYRGARPTFFDELDLPVINLRNSRRVPREHYVAALRALSPAHELPEVSPDGTGDIIEVRAQESMQQNDANEWEVPRRNVLGSPSEVHLRMQERADREDSMMHLCRTRRQVGAVSAALDAAGIPHTTQEGLPGGWGVRDEFGDLRRSLYNIMSAAQQCDLSHGPGEAPADDVLLGADNSTVDVVKAAPLEYLDVHYDAVRSIRDDLEEDGESVDTTCKTVADLDKWVSPGFWQVLDDPSLLRQWNIPDRVANAVASTLRRHGMGDRIHTWVDLPVVQTIHASKGSEASHVAVYTGVTESIIEAMQSSKIEKKNEHRVWYVALTRASESLYVVHDVVESMQELPENGPDLRGVAATVRQVTDNQKSGGD